MFCLYSKGCEYSLRALAEFILDHKSESSRARDICRKAGIPEAYARKSFQALARAGFLKAVSGPRGGYSLAFDPKKKTVLDVIQAMEGKDFLSACVLGFPSCGHRNPCAIHTTWLNMKEAIVSELSSQTMWAMAKTGRLDPRRNL